MADFYFFSTLGTNGLPTFPQQPRYNVNIMDMNLYSIDLEAKLRARKREREEHLVRLQYTTVSDLYQTSRFEFSAVF